MLYGHRLLVSILKSQKASEFYSAKLIPEYFVPDELPLYELIVDHLDAHGVLPKVNTVIEAVGDVPQEIAEPTSFYLSKIQARYAYSLCNKALKESSDFLKAKKTEDILQVWDDISNKIRGSATRLDVMDFGVEGLPLFQSTLNKKKCYQQGIKLGWPYLDTMSQGLLPGDIVTIVGVTGIGKSFCGLWAGYNAYMHQQKTVIFISMEISLALITDRMVGIFTKANLNEIKTAELTSEKKDDIASVLVSLTDNEHKFYVVNGNLKSKVSDVKSLIAQYNPDLVIIDGAYLMQHENQKLDRFARVTVNVEALKQLAEVSKIPMILSYQFNRDAAKKLKKGEEPGLDDIGLSQAIPQVSSIVLGLFQDESAETMNSRKMNVLKGRDGSTGSFLIHWSFDAVNFSQIIDDSNEPWYD